MDKSEYVGIDKDVLELIKRDIDNVCLGSDVEVNRMILNYHAETLKLYEDIVKGIELQNELLSIIYQDEISDFISEVKKNMEKKDKK